MARKQITFSIPDYIEAYVRRRVETNGFASVSEYLRELIREDCERHVDRGLRDLRPLRRLGESKEPTPPAEPARSYKGLASATRRYD